MDRLRTGRGGRASAAAGSIWSRAVLLASLAAALAIALAPLRPPPAAPADAPATDFSAARAMAELRAIARAPHPMGSGEHGRVRDHVLARLHALGLEPEVQRAASFRCAGEYPGFPPELVVAATVENVAVRLPGTASTGAILLPATYDSMPTTPGAGDPGASAAAVLEVLRALRSGPPLRNDLVAVFSDAEVSGSLGAKAFAAEHRFAKDVRLVLATRAVGPSGPSVLAHVPPGDARLVTAFAETPHPVAYSWATHLERSLRRGGELVEYLGHGGRAVGVASFLGWQAHHTAADSIARVDPRTLQQSGATLLSLTRRLGADDLAPVAADPPDADLAYVTVAPGVLVRHPARWAVPLAATCLLAWACLVAIAPARRRGLSRAVLAGFAAVPAALLAGGIAGSALWWCLLRLRPGADAFMVGFYRSGVPFAGIALVVAATIGACVARLGQRYAADDVLLGAAGGLAAGSLAVAAALPGAVHLVALPALALTGYVAWTALFPRAAAARWPRTAALALSAAVSIVVLAPAVPGLFALTVGLDRAGAQVLVVVPVAAVVVLTIGLAPQLRELAGARDRRAIATAAGVGSLLVASAWLGPPYDAHHPRPAFVAYVLDADARSARFVTAPPRLDAFTSQLFGPRAVPARVSPSPGAFPRLAVEGLETTAPRAELDPPRLELEGGPAEGARTVRLRAVSPRGANAVLLEVETPGPIAAAALAGRAVDRSAATGDAERRIAVLWHAPPRDGVELSLRFCGDGPLRAKLSDWSNGLPAFSLIPTPVRPPDTMPAPFDFADPTVVEVRRTLLPAGVVLEQ